MEIVAVKRIKKFQREDIVGIIIIKPFRDILNFQDQIT